MAGKKSTKQNKPGSKKLRVTLKRSVIGTNADQKANVRGLGLRKVRDFRFLENTPAVRGMIKQVIHLVDAEEVEQDA
jgi:large subunit ribosomal protein L30